MTVLIWILLFILAIFILRDIYFYLKGQEIVSVKTDERTPFVVEDRFADAITFATTLPLVNDGKQSALIIDAIVRPQLAFEQYDGIAVRGKAQMNDRVREDDYFEAAVLFAKGDPTGSNVINLKAIITMTPRKGLTLDEALSHMVDVPIDIIYMVVGRDPCHYQKTRVILTAEEIAKLTGVKLITD